MAAAAGPLSRRCGTLLALAAELRDCAGWRWKRVKQPRSASSVPARSRSSAAGASIDRGVHRADGFAGIWFKDPDGNILHVHSL